MSVEETKAKVTARIWQSIAQNGVELSAIPEEQLNTLVASIAEGVILAVDEALEEAGMAARQEVAAGVGLPSEERVLWEGRPFLSLVTWYQITTERIRIVRGLLGKSREDIELVRIQDLDHKQNLLERILGIGDIVIRSSDPSDPEAVFRNVKNPEQVHEIMRRAMLDARRRFRYSVQEEM